MSPGLAATYRYRLATPRDVPGVFAVLEEVAPEIPVLLDLPKRQMSIFGQIHRCISSGEVWIALDRDDQIVGFLLAEPDRNERFQHDNGALHLSYGGVKPSFQGQHIFSALLAKMKSKGVPLTATVLRSNKSDMLTRLLKLGFHCICLEHQRVFKDRDDLRWQP